MPETVLNELKEREKKMEILSRKWAPLLEGVKDDYIKGATALLLENELEYTKGDLKRLLREESLSATIDKFPTLAIPLVRRIFPGLIANEIAVVQALDRPVGLAYALRYVVDDTRGEYSPSTEMYRDGYPIESAYTGTGYVSVLDVSSVTGNFAVGETVTGSNSGTTATVESWDATAGRLVVTNDDLGVFDASSPDTITGGTSGATATLDSEFHYGTGFDLAEGELLGTSSDLIKKGSIKIVQKMIQAIERKMAADWSQEAVDDIKKVHNVDLEKEIIDYLTYEIQAEIDREIIMRMRKLALKNVVDTFDMTSSDGRWQEEKFKTLYHKVGRMLTTVGKTSRRGRANFIIATMNVIQAFEAIGNFDIATAFGAKSISEIDTSLDYQKGIVYMGTISNGTVKVYLDLYTPTDYVLVGYKGKSHMDAGLIYAPYIPLMIARAIHPNSFHPTIMLGSRYGVLEDLLDTEKYYGILLVKNLNFVG